MVGGRAIWPSSVYSPSVKHPLVCPATPPGPTEFLLRGSSGSLGKACSGLPCFSHHSSLQSKKTGTGPDELAIRVSTAGLSRTKLPPQVGPRFQQTCHVPKGGFQETTDHVGSGSYCGDWGAILNGSGLG